MSGPAREAPARLPALFPPLAFAGWVNLVTTLGGACGFAGLLAAGGGAVRLTAVLLGTAGGLDRLDGWLARRSGRITAFGGRLDSLVDALAFCALPAALLRAAGARGALSLAVLLLFVCAGLWRLAYFDVHGLAGEGRSLHYSGVPTTVAASWLLILTVAALHLEAGDRGPLLTAAAAVCAVLMVSRLRYPKAGPATTALYLLVPAAMAAAILW